MKFIEGAVNDLKIKGVRKSNGELVIDAEMNSQAETIELKEFLTESQIEKVKSLLNQAFCEILTALAKNLAKEPHG